MNLKQFIWETREYLICKASTFTRGDLHMLPQISKEDLLHYIQSLHSNFRRQRFMRFIRRLEARRLVLESNDHSLTFDPIFLY